MMTARYASTCNTCRAPIAKGATIAYSHRNHAEHEECHATRARDLAADDFDLANNGCM
jgi:hypothetical protein